MDITLSQTTILLFYYFYQNNMHSESIAKAIQAPYQPKQIFKRHNSPKSRSKRPKVELDLYYAHKIQVIIW